MAKIEDILLQMKRNPKGVRYSDLCKVCDIYFGSARKQVAAIEYIKHLGKVIQG